MNNKSHQTTRQRRRNRHRQHPSSKNPQRHPPIHSLPIPITQTYGDSGTNDTLRRRHRNAQSGSDENGQGGAEFHTKTTRGGVQGQTIAEVFHDVVAPCCETDDDC